MLQHKNEKVINKTVSLLPTQYIMSLIKELTQRLQGHAQSGLGMVKWLKAVLMIHTSYLMSVSKGLLTRAISMFMYINVYEYEYIVYMRV